MAPLALAASVVVARAPHSSPQEPARGHAQDGGPARESGTSGLAPAAGGRGRAPKGPDPAAGGDRVGQQTRGAAAVRDGNPRAFWVCVCCGCLPRREVDCVGFARHNSQGGNGGDGEGGAHAEGPQVMDESCFRWPLHA